MIYIYELCQFLITLCHLHMLDVVSWWLHLVSATSSGMNMLDAVNSQKYARRALLE
jgi:hypothetical protein